MYDALIAEFTLKYNRINVNIPFQLSPDLQIIELYSATICSTYDCVVFLSFQTFSGICKQGQYFSLSKILEFSKKCIQ